MAISFEKTINMLGWLPESLRDELDQKFNDIADRIAQDARNHHRFITRTGALEQSVTVEYTGNTVRAYLDASVAPYGIFVHDGQRSWAPDPFLEKAFTAHIKDIDAAIGTVVAKAALIPAAALAGITKAEAEAARVAAGTAKNASGLAALIAAANNEEDE